MIVEPTTTELLKKVSNGFELSMVIAKRARQIQDGKEPMIDTKEKSSITIASMEFAKDKFEVVKSEDTLDE